MKRKKRIIRMLAAVLAASVLGSWGRSRPGSGAGAGHRYRGRSGRDAPAARAGWAPISKCP